jgi:putative aminopeptidase FrvX
MMKLLKDLCSIHAPSGSELPMRDFLISYIQNVSPHWKVLPKCIYGPKFMDCLILVFGKPRTAIFAHMDSIGFTVRYQDQLVPIGGPDAETGYRLVGADRFGPIECGLIAEGNQLSYDFPRGIDRGTTLTFKPDFRETEKYVTSCSLDNRLGVFSALKVAETLTDGMIIFSTWEEHGGGSVPFLSRFMFEEYHVQQALVSDITWITEGVRPGQGVAISLRDRNIPRQVFIQKIQDIALSSGIMHQLEVEGAGSSDGRELQQSPYPIDWCFIGAAEQNVHSPNEKVHKTDIQSMIMLYEHLMKQL